MNRAELYRCKECGQVYDLGSIEYATRKDIKLKLPKRLTPKGLCFYCGGKIEPYKREVKFTI